MKFKVLSLMLCFSSLLSLAQEKIKYSKEDVKKMEMYLFNEGFSGPSSKKISTVVLKDGAIHKGYCKDIDTKKGQIYAISLKDSVTKKEETFKAEDVKEMYVFPSNFEKGMKVNKYMTNIRNIGTKKLDKSTTNEHIHFVNQTVSLKNKKDDKEFLMQVINPDFDSVIAVYHDPVAKETSGFGVGGMQLGGGVTKSFYIKKGDKVIWLHKDDFEDNYDFLFGDNAEFMKKYPKNSTDWGYLSFLINEYTQMSS
ncbi:hypothetical protein AR687_17420 [Flavobacteriaceae bacterium CRH]|jgi:hypothetical protein|nr:hypothetical protein AR687_17420 [Flavobacteriaceae bacterium CRH]